MGTNGKRRWNISIFRSNRKAQNKSPPPQEFVCPISGSLMFDPVVVQSGHTLDRTSAQVCLDLSLSPSLPDGSRPDLRTIIPNRALKSTILNWCDSTGTLHPSPPDYSSVEKIVRQIDNIPDSERELIENMPEVPPPVVSHAATELNHRVGLFDSSSSSSVESVIISINTPMLPFATRPLCFSPASTSSEVAVVTSSEDDEFVTRLSSCDVYEIEQALMSLRTVTRTEREARVLLCTPRLLSAVRPLLLSRYRAVQTNAAAAVVNLSLEKENKVRIVRSGIVLPIIDVLRGGMSEEAREHAAGAIFSLALDDGNKTAIGVLGALQPLLHALRSESERARCDSALALYHLSMVQSNRSKLVQLGAVPTLLSVVRNGDMTGRVMLVLCNLAACDEGRSAMLDGNAVEVLVRLLAELESESTRENCVAALYSLSHGSLRFKALAREARAGEVLREVADKGSERMKEKARKVLVAMRAREESVAEEINWEGLLQGDVSWTRFRVGRSSCGANST